MTNVSHKNYNRGLEKVAIFSQVIADGLQRKNLKAWATTIHKIFETNSSFHVR